MKQRGRENSERVAQGVDSFYKEKKECLFSFPFSFFSKEKKTKLFSDSEVCQGEWKLMEERSPAPLGNGPPL